MDEWKEWRSTIWPVERMARSKWRSGTRETEVRLHGWCEGGLGQQRNDVGGCASMREKSEIVGSPFTYVTE